MTALFLLFFSFQEFRPIETGLGRQINIPQKASKVLKNLSSGECGYIIYAPKRWRFGQLVYEFGKCRNKAVADGILKRFRKKWNSDKIVCIVFDRDFLPVK